MVRLYRAVPLDPADARRLEPRVFIADSDLDGLERAKERYGPDVPFTLWEGERRALTHKPLSYLMRKTAPA